VTYLRLVTDSLDGGAAASVNLIWHNTANPNYMLTRGDWAPTVPALQRSELALGGPYANVEEEIGVNVYGQTAAECLNNLDTLARLLDQADRWNPRRNENVSAVRLQYGATGGAVIWESVITGRSSGDETSGVILPSTFNQNLGAFVIEGVRMKFGRRGLLLNPISESAVSSSAANPTVQTCTFGSAANVSSPLGLSYHFLNGFVPSSAVIERAVVLSARSASRLQIYEAESGSLGTNVASAADAAALARGGNVAKYSPGVLSTAIVQNFSGFDSACRRLVVWAAVRNNSATTTFTIQLQAFPSRTRARVITIDTSTTSPRLVCLGRLSSRLAFSGVELLLTASAASGTFDIDYFVVQAVDDETSGAVDIVSPGGGTGLVGSNDLSIDPLPLSATTPLVASASPGIPLPLSRSGDAWLSTSGLTAIATILATSGTFWRAVDSGNNLLNTVVTATRNVATLTPR
jgi:hypothetical protein